MTKLLISQTPGNLITVSMTIPKKLKDRTHSLLKYRFTRSTSKFITSWFWTIMVIFSGPTDWTSTSGHTESAGIQTDRFVASRIVCGNIDVAEEIVIDDNVGASHVFSETGGFQCCCCRHCYCWCQCPFLRTSQINAHTFWDKCNLAPKCPSEYWTPPWYF